MCLQLSNSNWIIYGDSAGCPWAPALLKPKPSKMVVPSDSQPSWCSELPLWIRHGVYQLAHVLHILTHIAPPCPSVEESACVCMHAPLLWWVSHTSIHVCERARESSSTKDSIITASQGGMPESAVLAEDSRTSSNRVHTHTHNTHHTNTHTFEHGDLGDRK